MQQPFFGDLHRFNKFKAYHPYPPFFGTVRIWVPEFSANIRHCMWHATWSWVILKQTIAGNIVLTLVRGQRFLNNGTTGHISQYGNLIVINTDARASSMKVDIDMWAAKQMMVGDTKMALRNLPKYCSNFQYTGHPGFLPKQSLYMIYLPTFAIKIKHSLR